MQLSADFQLGSRPLSHERTRSLNADQALFYTTAIIESAFGSWQKR